MQKIITLPQIELNLENARVIEIPVAVGSRLEAADILLVIETQKATVDVPCGESGYLRALLVKPDDEVTVHDALAVLTDAADEPFVAPRRAAAAPKTVQGEKRSGPVAGRASAEPVETSGGAGEKIRAMPAARKRARDLGIDLATVRGTGPLGRISVEDVEARGQGAAAGSEPLTSRRKALIAQMEAGHREVPQISISRCMDVSGIRARKEGTTFTSRLVYHVARALSTHPRLRTVLEGDRLRAGPADVAVAMDTASGLVAPVVRQAEHLSFEAVAEVVADFRRRGEENRLTGDELRNGPFALTNLGMLGVDMFVPLVFSGQTAVLAVGRTKEEAGTAPSAWFTLAVDHRIVDGAEAARFLETLQGSIGQGGA